MRSERGSTWTSIMARVAEAVRKTGAPIKPERMRQIAGEVSEEVRGGVDLTISVYDHVAPYDHVDTVGAELMQRRRPSSAA